jgi:hypothetical protein
MVKNTQKMGILFVFIIMAFSCASAPKAEAPSSYDISQAVSAREAGETIDNDNRMITYSVSLELTVKNIEETRKILIERVKEYKGFIVRESENYITTRIPAENMDSFIVSAKSLGKIEDESKTGTDITDQYRDNIIRLESLRNIRDRYLALLEKANSVSDILSIEKELERINTQIELLEGKIKYAELSVIYSNITVRFKEKAKPGPVGWIFYGIYQGIKWLFIWN